MSNFMSNGNPFLTENTFGEPPGPKRMTRLGVATKLLLMIAILLGTGGITWSIAMRSFGDFDFSTLASVESGEVDRKGKPVMRQVVINPNSGEHEPLPNFDLSQVKKLMWIGVIGGLVVGLIIIFNKRTSPFLGPVYAGLEGLALGGISAMYELQFGGIVMQAAATTVMVMLVMLGIFASGVIKAGPKFVIGLTAAMLGILGVYIVDIILGAFFGSQLSIVHSNGWLGIGFSVFVCGMAALNFIIDFDTIERGIERGAPKWMEWYCGFGVLVTFIWLYLEILRLLAKLRSRD